VDGSVPIAVFNVDCDLYAIDDTCTHQDASLANGWVEGCFVECPLHSSQFDLRTGDPHAPPATNAVRTHALRIRDGHVFAGRTARRRGARSSRRHWLMTRIGTRS